MADDWQHAGGVFRDENPVLRYMKGYPGHPSQQTFLPVLGGDIIPKRIIT